MLFVSERAAARRLALTPAAVSRNVAQLERNLGVRLFQRSTRSLALTEAGQLFLREVGSSFNTIQNAVANLASAGGQPAGTLKVSMGTAFGRLFVVPLLGEFLRRYPAINPDWHFDNRQVDLIGQGFDAAISGAMDLSPYLGPCRVIHAIGKDAAGKLFLLDGAALNWREMKLPMDPGCKTCGKPA